MNMKLIFFATMRKVLPPKPILWLLGEKACGWNKVTISSCSIPVEMMRFTEWNVLSLDTPTPTVAMRMTDDHDGWFWIKAAAAIAVADITLVITSVVMARSKPRLRRNWWQWKTNRFNIRESNLWVCIGDSSFLGSRKIGIRSSQMLVSHAINHWSGST